MDWARHDHVPPTRPDPPALVRIEVRWRVLMGPSGRILSCGLYEHPGGVELRCSYEGEDALRTRVERSLGEARTHATAWLAAIKAKGSCTELPPDA